MEPYLAAASNVGALLSSPAGQQAYADAQAKRRAQGYLALAVVALVAVLVFKGRR